MKKIFFFFLFLTTVFYPILSQDSGNDGEKKFFQPFFTPKPGIEISDIKEGQDIKERESPQYKHEFIKLTSGRDKVNCELFYPTEGSNFPIVVMLHGSHPKRADAYYDVMAIDLAMHGYFCIFPHYFERNKKGTGKRSDWMRTIKDSIDFAIKQPNVNPERIGVIGYSTGAFLILGYAPSDKRITCVVAYYGGLSPCYYENASEHTPPTLLLHGTLDRIVPARRSLEAYKILREKGKPISVVIYPQVGHGFTLHKRGEWDTIVSEDAWERTLHFLSFYLNFPSWVPEVLFQQENFSITQLKEENREDVFDQQKLKTPYLDKVFSCREKAYIDPSGEEYEKVLKESLTQKTKKKR